MRIYAWYLLYVLLFSAFGEAYGQFGQKPIDKQQEALYLKESLSFIKQLEGKRLTASFLLLDKPTSLTNEGRLESALADTILYSKAELQVIRNYNQLRQTTSPVRSALLPVP